MANWIKGAIRKPGALHRQLGIPEGKNIPKSTLESAAKKGGVLGQRARLAETLSKLSKRSTKGSPSYSPDELKQGYRKL